MELLKIIFISIIQGITEFLPISSSGHIFLLKNITGLDIDATFDIVIHMGTLFAVLIIYFQEIKELLSGLIFKSINSKYLGNNLTRTDFFKIAFLFIIATIPAGITGLILEEHLDIEPSNTKNWMFLILGFCFFITALLLLSNYFFKTNKKEIKYKSINELSFLNALFIGLFQSLAVLPGISRSGSTITATLHTKLNREYVAKFSFILSIPIIFAAFLLKLVKLIQTKEIADIHTMKLLTIGLIVSFISGYFSLKFLISLIKKEKLWIFSIYLLAPITVSILLWILK